MAIKSLLLAVAIPVLAGAAVAGDAKIMVMDAYARVSTPQAKSGAIFLELMNQGEADRLVAASTDVAHRAELHTHEEDANGVMKMIHVEEGFALPAGESLMLKRGGKHVMLMGLKQPLEDGAMVPLTLTFEKAGDLVVEVPVDLKRKPKNGHSGHGDHGHGHKSGHGDTGSDS